MSKIVSKVFQDFLNSVPEKERNEKVILGVFQKHVPELAKSCGLCFLKVIIISKNKGNDTIEQEQIILDIETPFEEQEKEVTYPLDDSSFMKVVAAVSKEQNWNEDSEQDFMFLCKMLYFIYGKARVLNRFFQAAYIDKLTGAMNSERLFQYMAGLLKSGTFANYCASFVNIKNMKLFNEMYGTHLGDDILVGYVKKLQGFIKEDECVARMGGDNFFVVIQKSREDDLFKLLREMCVEIILPGDRLELVKVDARIGYYDVKSGDSISDIMNNSSIALDVAKKDENIDIVAFRTEMKDYMIKMRQLEEAIPEAIENREFVVYYQPKVRLVENNDYELCGGEALVRWNKNGHMVPPGEFIPILENNGLITEIDYYVFESVCQHIKRWEVAGLKQICISTNFSRRHLRDPRFADKIEEIVRAYQVNPSYLEIEITESYDEEDMEALTKFEERMHDLGIHLSMDDFGSGFSSLKMLKDMAADTIKLDKSIIDGVGGTNKKDDIIVSHMIRMIDSLGKDLIAEGVEHQTQADFLQENGCTKIQGFLYGKPMPEMEFVERMKQGK